MASRIDQLEQIITLLKEDTVLQGTPGCRYVPMPSTVHVSEHEHKQLLARLRRKHTGQVDDASRLNTSGCTIRQYNFW